MAWWQVQFEKDGGRIYVDEVTHYCEHLKGKNKKDVGKEILYLARETLGGAEIPCKGCGENCTLIPTSVKSRIVKKGEAQSNMAEITIDYERKG